MYNWFAIIWIGLIMIALTMSPSDQVHDSVLIIPGVDKMAHFVLFAVLYFLSAKAVDQSKRRISKWSILLWVCVYSLFTEFLQTLLKDRFFEILDIIANIMGALAAFLFYHRKKN